MSEDTGIESVESTESSASSESAPAVQTQEAAPQQEAVAEVKDIPFHEHPRFKEVIEQKNQASQRAEVLEKSYKDLQAQVAQLTQQYKQTQAPQKPSYDSLFKELEQMNPQFAGLQKEAYEKLQKMEVLEQRLTQQEQFYQSYQAQQAISQFDRLCEENKVSPEYKELYKEAVANAAYASKAEVSELPNLFKQAHERLSKIFDAHDRAKAASYVQQKTADKKPATQTGGTAVAATQSKAAISQADVKKALAEAIRARNSA